MLSGFDPSNCINRVINDLSAFQKIDFPDETSRIESQIREIDIDPKRVACVLIEPYQGIKGKLAPLEYMQDLVAWCKENDVVLAVDEIQSGFGRTGRLWAYEHFGIRPDLIVCGKGMSSSLPISALVGDGEMMDASPPRSIASTHSGNPICCAAAYASITKIASSEFLHRLEEVSNVFQDNLKSIMSKYPSKIVEWNGVGVMAAIQFATEEKPVAHSVVEYCTEHGLLLYRPGGSSAGNVKVSPPLTISGSDLKLGFEIFDEAIRLA